MEERRHKISRPNPFMQLCESADPPAARDLANVLTAAVLRNNTCLEKLHGGLSGAERQNGGARFSEPELQKLHAQASANLAAIQAVAATTMVVEKYIKGLGPCPELLNPLPAEQLSAMRQQFKSMLEPDEMLTLYNTGAGPALGSAKHWDTSTRSGGLWMELPPLSTPPVALKSLSRPELQTNCEQRDEEDLMRTWRAWHIMRVVFMHTDFLRGPCREEQYSSGVSVIDDADMKVMLVQASSNLEKVLQQRASLSTADFDLWLCDDRKRRRLKSPPGRA